MTMCLNCCTLLLHHSPAMNDIHRLDTPLPEAYLIPGFITASEEAYLLTKVEECGGTPVDELEGDNVGSPDSPRRFRGKAAGWKEVKGRRLMYWGGSVHPKGNTLIPLPLPAFMDSACCWRHNDDDDARVPVVVTLSIGSATLTLTLFVLICPDSHLAQRPQASSLTSSSASAKQERSQTASMAQIMCAYT